jgi:hypothetical protein
MPHPARRALGLEGALAPLGLGPRPLGQAPFFKRRVDCRPLDPDRRRLGLA